MRIPVVGVAIVLAVSSAAAAPAAGWSEDHAIFTAEAAQKAWGSLFRSGATPWTPDLADVLALEKRLPGYMRVELDRQARVRDFPIDKKNPLWERAKTYKRQYVGIRRQKRRIVYANFFCDASGTNWRATPVDVDDGGDCYFQVEYDVDKKTFADLSLNGSG
jgi:hypothetical protein